MNVEAEEGISVVGEWIECRAAGDRERAGWDELFLKLGLTSS